MSSGILVLIEHLKGEVTDMSFEMLGAARKIGSALSRPVCAVVLGKGAASLAGRLGAADAVLVIENAQLELPSPGTAAAVLKQVMEKKGADLVLVGGTNVSTGIGAALAIRANLPCINFCKNVRFEAGNAVFTSQLFGGKILVDLRLPDHRGIVCVYPGSFPADAGRSEGAPAVELLDLSVDPSKLAFQRFIEPAAGDVDITAKEILVGVGRGIQSQDNLGLAEELAELLGGAVCASRPVIDQGWLPLTRQVGKSGMSIKPKLYLAAGISGAPEHVEGMKNAQLTIAINTDPGAPIYDVAQYGVCGDLLEILPALTTAIKARKGLS